MIIINVLISSFLITSTDAHGYVKSPRSRNFAAFQDGKWSGGTATTPEVETCPHCLNRESGKGCGVTGSHDYNYPLNALGGPMPIIIEEELKKNAELEFSAVLTAHHKGHFEYKACPIKGDEVPTQECFDRNPLVYVGDVFYNAPPDPNYPERAYIPLASHSTEKDASGSYLYTHTYKLPKDLIGDVVIIQWHYVTANSCLPEGYKDYNWPAKGFHPGNLGTCGPLPPDGNGAPEQFWNCVNVKIVDSDSSPTSPSPTSSPVVLPTVSPVVSPTVSPVAPTFSPVAPPSLPTNPPSNVQPPITGVAGPDSSLIAYLGNWQSCPTLEQTSHYTHIIIAFAVTYTWNPSKNQCSSSCTIGSPVPVCSNQVKQDLVDAWREAGKKVILSFGGAGMGGSWAGDVNDCWEYCYGKERSVISQLDNIVRTQRFDGVDIDYEYFYETPEAQNFLKTVTTGLRSTLPEGSIVTHAPMDPDLLPQTEYYQVLKEVAPSLDFIMPQYYNGYTRAAIDGIDGTGSGSISAISHYQNLVNDMFGGDFTKVIFGFCISDCSGTGSNANAIQASDVMKSLRTYYPCNGGAFFWVADHDTNGSWSQIVGQEIFPYSGCSSDGARPTLSPTFPGPTKSPTFPESTKSPTLPQPTTSPTIAPTRSPVEAGSCPPNYTGLIATNDCKGFLHCAGGSLVNENPQYCQNGLRFDEDLQVCDWEANVDC
jgi:hypothetical protein